MEKEHLSFNETREILEALTTISNYVDLDVDGDDSVFWRIDEALEAGKQLLCYSHYDNLDFVLTQARDSIEMKAFFDGYQHGCMETSRKFDEASSVVSAKRSKAKAKKSTSKKS